jgi:hypothetical protein
VYKEYLTAVDTSDLNDLSVKHTPTKKKIKAMMKVMGTGDYRKFRDQLLNQHYDSFITPIDIIRNKNGQTTLEIRFSQPMISSNEKMAIVTEEFFYESQGYSSRTFAYKNIDGKWTIFLKLAEISATK